MPGIGYSVIDFLGHVVLGDAGSEEVITIPEAIERSRAATARYNWMRVAYETVVGYVIAGLVKCPIRINRPSRDGPPKPGKRQTTSLEEDVWNVRPNANQNHAEFMARLLDQMFLGNKGYALVVPYREQLWVADSWNLRDAKLLDPTRWWEPNAYENISINGVADAIRGPLSADEVFVFRAPETLQWRRLMRAMEDAYERMAKSAAEAFEDKNARRWALRMDAQWTGTERQQQEINAYLNGYVSDFVTGDDAVIPLWQGMQFDRMKADYSGGESTLDVVQIRAEAFRTVANCMRVPVSFLEGNVNNYETVLETMLTFAIDPVAKAIADEIAAKSFTQMERRHGSFARLDTTRIRHVDLFAVADKAEKLVGSMIDTPNEIRVFTGQDRVEGRPEMDDYQMTKNHERAQGGENNDDSEGTDAAAGGAE